MSVLSRLKEILRGRRTGDGGFAPHAGGDPRPDATAWAILALRAGGEDPVIWEPACQRLAQDQLPDGRLSIAAHHPEAYWPTSLAVLAWQGSTTCLTPQAKALDFLLRCQGNRTWWHRSALGHNPYLKGWSWITQTAPWVEPTALALTALKVSGHGHHERAQEAVRLLLDRQLPRGGWNAGNTIVFDQELSPNPESTAIALNALAEMAPPTAVEASLTYLAGHLERIRTPLALGWGLLGVGAWGARPAAAADWLRECVARQARYGSYDTSNIALLLVAASTLKGLEGIYADHPAS